MRHGSTKNAKDVCVSVAYWFDGDRSECELAVNCMKGVEFMESKWLEKAGILYIRREKSAISQEDWVYKKKIIIMYLQ